MAKTVAQFAGQMARLPGQVDTATRDGIGKGALVVVTEQRRRINAITHDGRLSGTTRNAKVGVNYKLRDTKDGAYARIQATGPLPLIERDVKDHRIPRANARLRRRRGAASRRKIVVIPGVGVRAYAEHPGTQGQHPFERGWDATRRRVPVVIHGEIRKAMVKVFK